jgi:hypothetical protein
MKAIRVDLSETLTHVDLIPVADSHIGDVHCKKEYLASLIAKVKSDPNTYCVLNGDLMNWASKTSVSDCYAEEYTPMEQIQMACDLFEPIKDKILGITPGNHERRAYRTEGIDITELVAKQLGLQSRYAKESATVFLRFGKTGGSTHNRPVCYVIYMNHGSGGGRKEGAKVIRLADMASIVDADIYIHSHTHLPMTMRQAFYRTSPANSSIEKVDRLFVNTSSMLEYGGYGELGEFKPNSIKTPVIHLSGAEKMFEATL